MRHKFIKNNFFAINWTSFFLYVFYAYQEAKAIHDHIGINFFLPHALIFRIQQTTPFHRPATPAHSGVENRPFAFVTSHCGHVDIIIIGQMIFNSRLNGHTLFLLASPWTIWKLRSVIAFLASAFRNLTVRYSLYVKKIYIEVYLLANRWGF